MKGLMMDFQLTLPTILKRAETYFPHQEIVTRMPDRSFHRYSFADFGRTGAAARGRLEGSRARAGRPGRDALLEPLPAPGGVPRDPLRRLRPAHAQPAPASERPRLHRHARGRQGPDRGQVAAAALGAVRRQDADRARLRRRGRLRGAARRRRPGRLRGAAARRGHGSGDVLHERHDRAAQGRPLLAPVHRPAHARPGARRAARAARDREGDAAAGRPDVPRQRVGLPLHVPDGRHEAGLPRPLPRSRDAARGLRAGGRHDHRGRADDLDGHPRHARRGARTGGTSRSSSTCSSAARPRRAR